MNKKSLMCGSRFSFSLVLAVVCCNFYLISRSHLPTIFIFGAQIYKEVGNLWPTIKDT